LWWWKKERKEKESKHKKKEEEEEYKKRKMVVHVVKGIVHPRPKKRTGEISADLAMDELDDAIKLWKFKDVYVNHNHREGKKPCGTVAKLQKSPNGDLEAILLIHEKNMEGKDCIQGLKNGVYKSLSLGQKHIQRGHVVTDIFPWEISIVDEPGRPGSDIEYFTTQGGEIIQKKKQLQQPKPKPLLSQPNASCNNNNKTKNKLPPLLSNYSSKNKRLSSRERKKMSSDTTTTDNTNGESKEFIGPYTKDKIMKLVGFFQRKGMAEDDLDQWVDQSEEAEKAEIEQFNQKIESERKRLKTDLEPYYTSNPNFPINADLIDQMPPVIVTSLAALNGTYVQAEKERRELQNKYEKLELENKRLERKTREQLNSSFTAWNPVPTTTTTSQLQAVNNNNRAVQTQQQQHQPPLPNGLMYMPKGRSIFQDSDIPLPKVDTYSSRITGSSSTGVPLLTTIPAPRPQQNIRPVPPQGQEHISNFAQMVNMADPIEVNNTGPTA